MKKYILVFGIAIILLLPAIINLFQVKVQQQHNKTNKDKLQTPGEKNEINSDTINSSATAYKETSAFKIISDSTNILEKKVQTIELEYIVWGCACANWITPSDRKKSNTGLLEHCIFIEPARTTLILPDTFKFDKENIKITGQFYVRKDYPKGTVEQEEKLEKARVFRYTKIVLVKKQRD